jgi:hypothetical protein
MSEPTIENVLLDSETLQKKAKGTPYTVKRIGDIVITVAGQMDGTNNTSAGSAS